MENTKGHRTLDRGDKMNLMKRFLSLISNCWRRVRRMGKAKITDEDGKLLENLKQKYGRSNLYEELFKDITEKPEKDTFLQDILILFTFLPVIAIFSAWFFQNNFLIIRRFNLCPLFITGTFILFPFLLFFW